MGYGNAGSGWAARDGSAGQWRAAAGARRFCLTRRLAARGDGILARGRRCVAGEPTVAGMPRRPGPGGSHSGRGRGGAPTSPGTSSRAPGAKTFRTDPL
jgi:hypothetical protein